MDGRKFTIATAAGGITLFLAGLLVGLALSSFREAHSMTGVSRDAPRWIVLFVANLANGALLTTVIGHWARTGGGDEGARIGALLGFLVILGIDLTLVATSNVFNSLRAATVDMFGFTLTFALGGGVVGAVLGRR